MGIEYKDYYAILGVPRTAGAEDIRKAFRKLARQHHPDVAKNKAQAEEKFKEINEAHDVLSDPEKRRKYDALGANWKQGAEFRPPPGWEAFGAGRGGGFGGGPGGRTRRGRAGGVEFEFGGTGFSDFFEQLFGRQGGPQAAGAEFSERGQDIESDLRVTLEEAVSGVSRTLTLRRAVECDRCGGSGEQRHGVCPACHGAGQVSREETIQVRVPPGVTEGQQLRVGGKGGAGAGGGKPGDLLLRVRLAGHPDFRMEENNLSCDLDVAPWEAVLGATVAVPTLDGHVSIKIPPGTPGGSRLRVRGRGLGREGHRGDLVVVVRVQVPERVSDEERRLWEELAARSHFRPRE
jgi:curved DNA-binding protein